MHELSLMQDMVEAIELRLREVGRRRATRVVLDVGLVAGVLPEALRFCFAACSRSGPVAGAALEIREIPGRARCRGCGAELKVAEPYGVCACGSARLEWLAGHELKIRELEVE